MKDMIVEMKLKKIITGLFITIIGVFLLLNKMGVLFPVWFLTWPMILISIGLFKLLISQFKSIGGFVLTIVGSFFLVEQMYPEMSIREYVWPIILITIGLLLMFKSKNQDKNKWIKSKCEDYKFKKSKFTSYEN